MGGHRAEVVIDTGQETKAHWSQDVMVCGGLRVRTLSECLDRG